MNETHQGGCVALTAEDRAAVTELISLHGHLVDEGALDRLGELLTDDVVYDLSDFGRPPLVGVAAFRDAALAMGDANPVGHHVTNVVISEVAEGVVDARSKAIGVYADGTCGSVTYEDTVTLGDRGWRISRRRVAGRRAPLGGLTG